MPASPSEKSLRLLREFDYRAFVVEAYQHPLAAKFSGGWAKKKDLLGLGDILALKAGETLMVNATSNDNVSHHVVKYMDNRGTRDALTAWLGAGNPFVIHGWRADQDPDDACIVREAYLSDGEINWA